MRPTSSDVNDVDDGNGHIQVRIQRASIHAFSQILNSRNPVTADADTKGKNHIIQLNFLGVNQSKRELIVFSDLIFFPF